MSWITAGLIFLSLLIVGWIAGEVRNNRPVRIACITMFILASSALTIAAALTGTLGSMNTSLALTEASQKWMQSAAGAMQAQQLDAVRAELDALAAYTPTYESVTYVRAVEESAERLGQR